MIEMRFVAKDYYILEETEQNGINYALLYIVDIGQFLVQAWPTGTLEDEATELFTSEDIRLSVKFINKLLDIYAPEGIE